MLIKKIKRKDIKGLCTSVKYGPNASGKTNIIGAMDTFRAIVIRQCSYPIMTGAIKMDSAGVMPDSSKYGTLSKVECTAFCILPSTFYSSKIKILIIE